MMVLDNHEMSLLHLVNVVAHDFTHAAAFIS